MKCDVVVVGEHLRCEVACHKAGTEMLLGVSADSDDA